MKIWQAKTDYSEISPFLDHTGTNLTAQVVESGEAEHGKVFEMTYNADPDWSALPQFFVSSPADTDGIGLRDMGTFVYGKISFDIKVLANPNNIDFVTRVECKWPCNSRDNTVVSPTLNQWKHIELPIADLVAQGLNLQHVGVAFEVSPLWGKQANISYQIDNIRWEKGDASATDCTTSGAVFVNGNVCAPWNGVSYFEGNTDYSQFWPEVTDHSVGKTITEKTITSNDAGHTKVLDISYSSNSSVSGFVRTLNSSSLPTGVDMSEFSGGIYVFDFKVIAPQGDTTGDLVSSVDCSYPCITEQPIKISALNQWQTFSISAQQLINSGLDIQHVMTGFEIAPEWGHQANWHYQIDNVRWVKTSEPITREICYMQSFKNFPYSNNKLETLSQHSALTANSWISGFGPAVIFSPKWNEVSEPWVFGVGDTTQTLNSCLTKGFTKHGTASIQVYLPASYITDGKMFVTAYIGDSNNNIITGYYFRADFLRANEWNTISIGLTQTGSAITNGQYLGVQFDGNGTGDSADGGIKVDNFIVTMDK